MGAEDKPVETCDYCGLPLPASRGAHGTVGDDTGRSLEPRDGLESRQYCCFGCRFAAAVAAESGEEGQARWTLVRLGLSVFFAMIVMVFSLALWSQDVYEVGDAPATKAILDLFRYACLLATVPVVLLLGGPLLENAWVNWRQGRLSTDALLVVGVVSAFAVSVRSVLLDQGGVYFEVACVVLLAVTLGRWLEATGRLKTTQALRSLEKLLPAEARVVQRHQGQYVQEHLVPLAEVRVGQSVRVLPGERIAVDGVIRRNQAAVDEQFVTGESQPSVKETGDRVLAGSLNLDGDLVIEVTAAPSEGTLQRLINAVVTAALTRGRIQRMADRISSWFLPAVVLLAGITLGVHTWWSGLEAGLLASLAVLLIACPCALGIATPLAIWAAMGRAARVGVVFRDGDALHRAAGISAVVFDKTGTLTTGDPEVIEVVTAAGMSRGEFAAIAGRVASTSTHHLAAAIRQYCEGECDVRPLVDPAARGLAELTQSQPGKGVIVRVAEVVDEVYLGSPRWLEELGLRVEPELQDRMSAALGAGAPLACVGWGGEVRGAFVFRERLRAETPAALRELREAGLSVSILTGDHRLRGELLAREVGVEVLSEQLPDDKLRRVQRLRSQIGPVAMVGDGVNDAPALAAADVGIAMGCGADVSRDSADLCLLGNDLRRVWWSLRLARQSMRTIHYNLFWAFAYNAVGVAIAAAGWLNPIWAAAAMVVSSLLVITNSLRLSREGVG